jgi:RNA polymerase sigma-54 factor
MAFQPRVWRLNAMVLAPRLNIRTSQTLVLSPQLQAAIKLLALSNLELQAEILSELDRNPLLELADDNEPGGNDATGDPGDPSTDAEAAAGADEPLPEVDAMLGDRSAADSADDDFSAHSGGESGPTAGAEELNFDSFAAEGATLAEILERQAMGLPTFDHAVALHLIALLDEAGYLTEPVPSIAARLGVAEAEVERVLHIIQGFEPTGVGARNLAECIALQAREADRYDPCMARLIDHLDLVARGDLLQLRRICEVDSEDLADMLRELRGYDPKPGLVHGGGRTHVVVPDVFVRRTGTGWTVELNAATLPRLVVNRQYQMTIAGRTGGRSGKVEKQFVDQCVTQANWLIRALDQRANTILKVVTALVEAQQGFFEQGVQQLKPLTLKAIAERIEMHESTISRVTSNKYLSCNRGVFELKYFFTAAIQGDDGADASAETVRARLKALIEAEPPLKPYSDDRLVELLKADGYTLARRTVTKYREAMHIPSSFNRRRQALVRAA